MMLGLHVLFRSDLMHLLMTLRPSYGHFLGPVCWVDFGYPGDQGQSTSFCCRPFVLAQHHCSETLCERNDQSWIFVPILHYVPHFEDPEKQKHSSKLWGVFSLSGNFFDNRNMLPTLDLSGFGAWKMTLFQLVASCCLCFGFPGTCLA